MEKRTQISIWYFLLAFFALILLQRYVFTGHIQNISYSEFRKLVQEKKVNELVITSEVTQKPSIEKSL